MSRVLHFPTDEILEPVAVPCPKCGEAELARCNKRPPRKPGERLHYCPSCGLLVALYSSAWLSAEPARG